MNIEIGGGFFSLLTLIFITLKLLGYITWSWWWVLSPMLIPIGIGAIFLLALGIIAIIMGVLDL